MQQESMVARRQREIREAQQKKAETQSIDPVLTGVSSEFQARKKSIAGSLPNAPVKPGPDAKVSTSSTEGAATLSAEDTNAAKNALLGLFAKRSPLPPTIASTNTTEVATQSKDAKKAAMSAISGLLGKPRMPPPPPPSCAADSSEIKQPESKAATLESLLASMSEEERAKALAAYVPKAPVNNIEAQVTDTKKEETVMAAPAAIDDTAGESALAQVITAPLSTTPSAAFFSAAPATLDATTKEKYIDELDKVAKHYGNGLNQIAEKATNFLGITHKTTTDGESRANKKKRIANALITLISANNNDLAHEANKIIISNKLTSSNDFFEGKVLELLSPDLMTLLGRVAPAATASNAT